MTLTFKSVLITILLASTYAQTLAQHKEILYIGTYSVRGSKGIYVVEFDHEKVELKITQSISSPESPTFLEIHPSGKFLYSVNRGGVNNVVSSGSLSAYSIDPSTRQLKFINSKSSFGLGPCHIAITADGKNAMVAQYNDGTFGLHSILPDGSIGALTDSLKYNGHGPVVDRQQSGHVHSATFSVNKKFVLVADLGSDKIYSFESHPVNGKLVAARQPVINVHPGAGPRHIAFHPNGKYFYLVEELTSTVGVFSFNPESGEATVIQDQVVSLPPDFKGTNTAADIHTSNDGKFLYMSNRGANVISIFSIGGDGKLKLIGHQDTLGKTPRNFMVEKTGEYIFVANQDSDNLVVFKRNRETGMLVYTGVSVAIPSPACIKSLR